MANPELKWRVCKKTNGGKYAKMVPVRNVIIFKKGGNG
jgi:hypothetical protein